MKPTLLGKSRYGFVAGESPDIVRFLGEVPRYFGRWGKSWDCLFGEVPRCDVTPHIGEKRAQQIILWKTRFTIYSFHKMEKTYSFHKMITII